MNDPRQCSQALDQGNPDVHVILRGGASGPNYATEFVRECGSKLVKAGLAQKIMVCNSIRRENTVIVIL